ncbi:hypothetical protein BHE74_00029074 [Ensete ventricosum]|nr:hypothetical protein BHE74_00029074 [Ensete ventricosum]
MDRSRALRVLMLLWLIPGLTYAGDIVHEDDKAPKLPGCSNHFILVKVQTWINNEEDSEFVGVGARFGTTIQTKEKYTSRTPLSLSDPSDCCTAPKEKVCYSVIIEVVHTIAGDILLVHRGRCKFTTKAKVAEAAGASALLIINNRKGPTNMLGGYVITVPQDIRATFLHWFKRAGETFIKVPFFGAVSYLTLAVSPFCVAFAVLWAVYRRVSFAWIGQDVLGIALIITVLQIVRVPNLKVRLPI